MEHNRKYMYDNKYTKMYDEEVLKNRRNTKEPYLRIVENGVILPQRNDPLGKKQWGIGGVIDEKGNFVDESAIETAFGGSYEQFGKVEFLNSTVLFIPCVMHHWGHFLLNTLCRLWPFDVINDTNILISFCTWGFNNQTITDEYNLVLNCFGIDEGRRIKIEKPTRFSKIIIPSETFGYASMYNDIYKDVVQKLIKEVNNSSEVKRLVPISKLYFSRRKFQKHKFNEIGEKKFEKIFKKNGFTILAPEELTLFEEIFYISHCDMFVCFSGTTAHNGMFLKKGAQLIILNRTNVINPPQIKINTLFKIDYVIVDCYHKKLNKILDYGMGPYLLEINKEFISFLDDYQMSYSSLFFYKFVIRPFNFIRYEMAKVLIYIYTRSKQK